MAIKGKFAVIGIGLFGSAIAKKLKQEGAEVIAIDKNNHIIEDIRHEVTYAVVLDSTDKNALLSQDVQDMDAVVVAIGENFQNLLLTTFVIQELGIERIIVRSQNETQKKILQNMGIKEILSPEDEVGISVAHRLINPEVITTMSLPDNYEIAEIISPKNVIDRTLDDLGLRQKYRLNLVTLLREKNGEYHIEGVPSGDTVIRKTDRMLVFGSVRDIERFIEINQ